MGLLSHRKNQAVQFAGTQSGADLYKGVSSLWCCLVSCVTVVMNDLVRICTGRNGTCRASFILGITDPFDVHVTVHRDKFSYNKTN